MIIAYYGEEEMTGMEMWELVFNITPLQIMANEFTEGC